MGKPPFVMICTRYIKTLFSRAMQGSDTSNVSKRKAAVPVSENVHNYLPLRANRENTAQRVM